MKSTNFKIPNYKIMDTSSDYTDVYCVQKEVKNIWEHTKGDNVNIAVIDSGIDKTHSDFEGSKINEAKRFEEDLLVTDIDLESVENSRLHDLRTRKRAAVEFPVNSDLDLILVPKFPKKVVPPNVSMRKSQPYDELSEIYNALKLGTRDYVRKCGFEKALIALSGGIDSSLVAAIAVDALGKDNVMGVAMPSRYSSKGSVDDATKLSKNLQIELLNIPIETMFSEFLKSLS